MVGVWIRLARLRYLLAGAGDVDSELPLHLADRAVVYLVHD